MAWILALLGISLLLGGQRFPHLLGGVCALALVTDHVLRWFPQLPGEWTWLPGLALAGGTLLLRSFAPRWGDAVAVVMAIQIVSHRWIALAWDRPEGVFFWFLLLVPSLIGLVFLFTMRGPLWVGLSCVVGALLLLDLVGPRPENRVCLAAFLLVVGVLAQTFLQTSSEERAG